MTAETTRDFLESVTDDFCCSAESEPVTPKKGYRKCDTCPGDSHGRWGRKQNHRTKGGQARDRLEAKKG